MCLGIRGITGACAGALGKVPSLPRHAPRYAGPVTESTDETRAAEPSLFKRLGAAGPLAVVAAIMPALAGIALLWKINVVSEWLRTHGAWGACVYAAAFALLAGLALLPTYAQALLGGWAFGFALGMPAALAGFAGGAMIGYEVARRLSKDRVQAVIDEKPKWRAVRDALVGGRDAGFWKTTGLVTLLRLPPNSPFALTNLVMAGVRVPRLPYFIGTVVGMAPRTALAVMLGAGINVELTKETLEAAMPLKLNLGMLFVTVAFVLIIGHLATKAIARVTAEHDGSDQTGG